MTSSRVDKIFRDAERALDAEDLDRAIALMTKAIALEPKNAALVQSRGAVHAMKNDSKAAIADYSKAIALAPKYADAYLNRGLAHWENGAAKAAARDLAKAVALGLRAEIEPQGRYFLGRAHEALGDVAAADVHFKHLVIFAPDTDYARDAAMRSIGFKLQEEEKKPAKKRPAKKRPAKKRA